MNLTIEQATDLSLDYLQKLGFSNIESKDITDNLILAELSDKKTHGLVRLKAIKKNVDSGSIAVNDEKIEIKKETSVSLLIDGKKKTGFHVIKESLNVAFNKIKISGILAVGLTNTEYASGYITEFARMATKKDLIFIGFNNSPGRLIPHGTKKALWGTNPITIGIPTNSIPVILDMASSQITWGELLVAKETGKNIPENTALDASGNMTIDPLAAMEGGLLPFAGHKGSGLAFIVELLAGGLTSSRIGYDIKGGWGTFYILINPSLFRDITEFKNDIDIAIKELKSLPKSNITNEIHFPGEKSFLKIEENTKKDSIFINDKYYAELSA